MEQECKDAIYAYVDEETQMNAALTGEHREWVTIVIQLLRDQYHEQVAAGRTTFTIPDDLAEYLQQSAPW